MKYAIIENMVTVASTAALILGLYAMGAGGWAAGGFLLLINMNTSYRESTVPPSDHGAPTVQRETET